MASPLGDQPGRQRPPANSCPAPASPGDPGPVAKWGSCSQRSVRAHGGSGCGKDSCGMLASSPGGEQGVVSHRSAEPAAGLCLPQGFSVTEREDCLALPQISSLNCLFFYFSLSFFPLLKSLGFV